MSELYNFHPGIHLSSIVQDIYIETGVGLGKSFQFALKSGFRILHGIEYNEECFSYYDEIERLAHNQDIHFYSGSSPDVLSEIIISDRLTTFWLDAHYTGDPDFPIDPLYGECPLLNELKVITTFEWRKKPIILIDDACIFTGSFWRREAVNPNLHREQWPNLDQILDIMDPHQYDMILREDILYFF